MKRIFLIFIIILRAVFCFAQSETMTARMAYVEKYYPVAIEKMQQYGIPASITLAQGILESGSGKSELAVEANNHFGIKCHKEWDGETYYMDDDRPNECFRKYSDPGESYNDHSLFLTTRSRYDFLFSYKKDDYKKWARGLKKAGYATNPQYAHLLIKIIEETDLHKYDKMALDPGFALPEKNNDELAIASGEKPHHNGLNGNTSLPKTVNTDDFDVVKKSDKGRPVYENRGVKFIVAENSDTFFSIAEEFALYSYQIYKYNELSREDILIPGEIVYLEKKNKKAAERSHTIQPGESLRFISQYYAIRLDKLLKINSLQGEKPLDAGTVLKLH